MAYQFTQTGSELQDLIDRIYQLAEEYDSSTSYSIGDYCSNEGKLWKCTTPTTGTFNAADWTDSVFVLDEVDGLDTRLTTAEGDITALNTSLAQCIRITSRVTQTSTEAFEAALMAQFASMSDYDLQIGLVRAQYIGSVTGGAWAIGIYARISNGVYKIDIPDTCASGYYYSGEWHWTKATMA